MYTHAPVSSNFDGDDSAPKSRNWKFEWRSGRASLAFIGVLMVVGAFISASVQQIRKRGTSNGNLSSIEQLAAIPSDKCKQWADITIKGVNHNNLGGVGPDIGDETLIYDLSMGSESFLLEVAQVSSNKGATVHNGLWKDKGMGKINVRGGQTVRVRFKFFDKETRNPKRIPKFAFTFYDLDQHAAGKEEEFVKLYTYQSAVKTKGSEVSHTSDDVTGAETFASSKPGGWRDNPNEPMTLNRQQRDRAVTLTFADTSGFEADLGNTGQKVSSKSHRAVLFAPKATLYCIGHLEEITREPVSTTLPTTSKSGGVDTEADLKKMIRDNKYVKTATAEEKLYFANDKTNLFTTFTDAGGTKHQAFVGAFLGAKKEMVWKVSGDIQFHSDEVDGGENVTVALPTSDTTLVEGTFEYQAGGYYHSQSMKLTLQGYKSATSH